MGRGDLFMELLWFLIGILFILLSTQAGDNAKIRVIVLRTCGLVFILAAILHNLGGLLSN